jgi:ABC-type branched-subunit amino acid transport system ATPase component
MLSMKGWVAGYGESTVIRNLNLTVEPGQIVCLMGRNGRESAARLGGRLLTAISCPTPYLEPFLC